MPTNKIADLPHMCKNSDHNPPTNVVLSPGIYEHICPECGKTVTFAIYDYVGSTHKTDDPTAKEWNRYTNDATDAINEFSGFMQNQSTKLKSMINKMWK